MSGNVWEWCLNQYHEPEMITPDSSDSARVLRGGSWYDFSGDCRSACRSLNHPDYRLDYRGFRIVCVPHLITDNAVH